MSNQQPSYQQQRYFVCQLFPQDMLRKYHISQAANNFFRNLIDSGVFDQVITLVPVCVADDLRQACLKMPGIDHVVQCRFFPNKGLGRVLNCLIENLQLFKLLLHVKSIWFYNITSCNFIAFLLLYLCRKKIFLILADFTPPSRFWDLRIFLAWCIKRTAGIISLSARTEFKHHNMQVLPGIVPAASIDIATPATCQPHFLFSGTLNAVTGLDMALQTFGNAPEFQLVITGSCGNGNAIREKIAGRNNIRYLGNLSYEEYRKTLHDAAWALNLRNPHLPENANNFPSKILEYLASGKIVLSTMYYPELEGFRYFYADFNEESIKKMLRNISMLSEQEMQEIREYNRQRLQFFSGAEWKKAILRIEMNVI